MTSHPILLVEDNPDDIELTLRAFRRNNLATDKQLHISTRTPRARHSPTRRIA